MKNTLLTSLAICLFICFTSYAQTVGLNDGQIQIGSVDSIYSDILGEQRPFWVSVPRSAENSKRTYPVVYVLDGTAHFYSTVGMIHQLSVANGNTILPEMIVVGIPNVNRVRDLTPSQVPYMPSSGGAENFTNFIEKELIPFIESKYPVTPYRTLVGHSWGGLFVLNTLVYHTGIFDNYVAIDPSIRWDNLNFFNSATQKLQKGSFDKKSLHLSVANRLPKGLDLNTVMEDTLKSSEHMRTTLQFVKVCENTSGLEFDWKFYENDNHNGVPFIAMYGAFRYLFEWYNFDEEVLFREGQNMTVDELMDMVINHFKNISDQFGYSFLPPEALINRYGDIVMYERWYEKARALYQLNIDNYPQSFRAYDAMGDLHRAQGDNNNAISFYRKSLEMEENVRVRRKLNNLSQTH